MILTVLLLIAGFVALVYGADILVDGSTGLAKRYGLSNLVIGATIVAMGTSLPELVVNLLSAYRGETDLAITNVVGSNIINTFVILGITALIHPVFCSSSLRKVDVPLSAVSCLIVAVMLWISGVINWICGIILIGIFSFYMWRMVKMSADGETDPGEYKPLPLWKSVLMMVAGVVLLALGGHFIVDGAVKITAALGVPESIIGLTVVALGTSLPELAASVVAATKKNTDLAIGNIIGSNIFNVFFVLGISSCLNVLPGYDGVMLDVCMASLGSVIVWIAVTVDRERKLRWWHGLLLLTVYTAYLVYRIITIHTPVAVAL